MDGLNGNDGEVLLCRERNIMGILWDAREILAM